jgi:metal-responsive CopG/Arc/MetJ family transcriptional regulator
MAIQAKKLTISIPRNLLVITDEIAKEKKISRSKLVSSCLQEMAERHLQERMAEGYKKMAKEHLAFAKKSLPLVNEILHEWK